MESGFSCQQLIENQYQTLLSDFSNSRISKIVYRAIMTSVLAAHQSNLPCRSVNKLESEFQRYFDELCGFLVWSHLQCFLA